MNPFEAFQARATRRLEEMRHDLAVELTRLHADVVKDNAQTNNRSIFPKLRAVSACADVATEFVLREAKALTDRHRDSARGMWLEETATRARFVLMDHVEAIYASDWRMPPEFMHLVNAHIRDFRSSNVAKVNNEVVEFEQGVWNASAEGSNITNNTVNINGGMSGGVVQQAGDNAHQHASGPADAEAIGKALEAFVRALDGADLSPASREEIMADVDTVRAQLKKPSPNFDAIRHAARDLSVGVAANIVTPHLLLLLAAVGLS